MTPENGASTENELETLINKWTLNKEDGVIWMILWDDLHAELTR